MPAYVKIGYALLLTLLMMGAARAEFHVSPSGSDAHPGTETQPFQTLERARDAIRALKQQEALPDGGVTVLIHPGEYPVRETFRLSAEDSGAATAPIIYRAAGAERPRFTGGVRLGRFKPIEDPAVLARLPEAARGQVWEADLAAAGVTDIIPFELGGFSSGRGFKTFPAMELFVDGEPMTLARWPNDGFVHTGEVPGPLTLEAWDRKSGAPHGRFQFEGDRPERWTAEPDAWLYGYWFWDWADSYEKIAKVDLEKREILLEEPWHKYGYRHSQRYYAINLLAELDVPGEWYLDRERGRVYLYPQGDLEDALVEISVTPQPLLHLEGASHLRFQGLLWELGAGDGLHVLDGEQVHLEGCTIRKMAGNGVNMRGGRRNVLQSCNIHTLGRGGIALSGGDRKTLTPGEHLVENCHIHHLSRIDHTYTPGVWLDGVGNRIRHNRIHDVASSAMRIEGNDHLIELNDVFRVVMESDDQGAVDMFGNPTYQGNIFRHNYWHHLGNPSLYAEEDRPMQAGIRLDDAICGVLIQGNVFHQLSLSPTHFGAVQIHGGKDNIVEGNLMVDCGAAVSFSPWGDTRWRTFVAEALDHRAIDRALYLERYPSLAQLSEEHDANTIRENVVLRCDAVFLRAPEQTEAMDNHVDPEATAFREGPDGRLIWSPEAAAKLGLTHIPFEKIGLYDDAWRGRSE